MRYPYMLEIPLFCVLCSAARQRDGKPNTGGRFRLRGEASGGTRHQAPGTRGRDCRGRRPRRPGPRCSKDYRHQAPAIRGRGMGKARVAAHTGAPHNTGDGSPQHIQHRKQPVVGTPPYPPPSEAPSPQGEGFDGRQSPARTQGTVLCVMMNPVPWRTGVRRYRTLNSEPAGGQ